MNKTTLAKKLSDLGFPLFTVEESVDVNNTLAEVVESKEIRFWEGFPILIANSIEKEHFNLKEVELLLENKNDKKNLKNLTIMSLVLYKYLKIKLPSEKIYKSDYFDEKVFNQFLSWFKENQDLRWNTYRLSSLRVINTFKNYYRRVEVDVKEYLTETDDFDLEYALSQIFSKKQKDLFFKKLKGEKMTKTEREYYSRSVKKKVIALANSDLHKLAVKLLKV